MFKSLTKFGSFAAAVAMATSAHALTTMSISMGPPIVNGNSAQIDVMIDFTDDVNPNSGLTGFFLDVTPSDSALTNGQTDYSRFSFTPSSPLLDNWQEIIGFDNTPFGSTYAIGVDTSLFAEGLTEGGNTHIVGTLNVLLAGLAPGNYVVAFDSDPFLTLGLFQPDISLGDPQSEDFVEIVDVGNRVTITVDPNGQPSIPEPATMALGVIGLAALATRRRRA